MKSTIKAVRFSAEMELRMGLSHVMTVTLSVGMAVHLLVLRNLTISVRGSPAPALFRVSAATLLKRLPLSLVMTIILSRTMDVQTHVK